MSTISRTRFILNDNELLQKSSVSILNNVFFLLLDTCLKKFVFSNHITLGQSRISVGEEIHLDANVCN